MDEKARQKATFTRIQPFTSKLLYLREDATSLAACLNDLHATLLSVDDGGLDACADYVLFPLLFIVDSIPGTRQEPRMPAADCASCPVQFDVDLMDLCDPASCTGLFYC